MNGAKWKTLLYILKKHDGGKWRHPKQAVIDAAMVQALTRKWLP